MCFWWTAVPKERQLELESAKIRQFRDVFENLCVVLKMWIKSYGWWDFSSTLDSTPGGGGISRYVPFEFCILNVLFNLICANFCALRKLVDPTKLEYVV